MCSCSCTDSAAAAAVVVVAVAAAVAVSEDGVARVDFRGCLRRADETGTAAGLVLGWTAEDAAVGTVESGAGVVALLERAEEDGVVDPRREAPAERREV